MSSLDELRMAVAQIITSSGGVPMADEIVRYEIASWAEFCAAQAHQRALGAVPDLYGAASAHASQAGAAAGCALAATTYQRALEHAYRAARATAIVATCAYCITGYLARAPEMDRLKNELLRRLTARSLREVAT